MCWSVNVCVWRRTFICPSKFLLSMPQNWMSRFTSTLHWQIYMEFPGWMMCWPSRFSRWITWWSSWPREGSVKRIMYYHLRAGVRRSVFGVWHGKRDWICSGSPLSYSQTGITGTWICPENSCKVEIFRWDSRSADVSEHNTFLLHLTAETKPTAYNRTRTHPIENLFGLVRVNSHFNHTRPMILTSIARAIIMDIILIANNIK
jgi:hypothetical protein